MGGTWRQAWSIVGWEIKIDRYYVLGSLLFIAYMGFFSGLLMDESLHKGGFRLLLDLMFWMIVSMIGYYFSRRITKYITEDSYTHMLAYYRTLPITPQVVATARLLQLLLSTLGNGILLFGLIYLFNNEMRTQMDLGHYMAFVLTWVGFCLAFNSLYVLMELLMRGKAYFWYSLVLLVVVEAIALILHFSGISVVESSIRMSAEQGLASPAAWIMLLLGAVGIYASYRIIVSRLSRRDLA